MSFPREKTAGLAGKVFLGVPAAYMASGLQESKYNRDPESEGVIGRTVREHPDLISAGIVAEHMVGSPVTGKIGNLANKGVSALKTIKVAGMLEADILKPRRRYEDY
jgi:hypothetical protein